MRLRARVEGRAKRSNKIGVGCKGKELCTLEVEVFEPTRLDYQEMEKKRREGEKRGRKAGDVSEVQFCSHKLRSAKLEGLECRR